MVGWSAQSRRRRTRYAYRPLKRFPPATDRAGIQRPERGINATTISGHLRNNVVGYLALFLVLTGGTAYALDGSNTVFSDDIVNGEVRTADVRAAAVTSPKIGDDAVTGATEVADGSLAGADLGDRSIGGQKVGLETLTGANVSDGSLFSAEIANDSLLAADVGGGAIGFSELNFGRLRAQRHRPQVGHRSAVRDRAELDPDGRGERQHAHQCRHRRVDA